MSERRALVFGGTGAVGREVLRGLAEAGVTARFTYLRNAGLAQVIEKEYGHEGFAVDLADPGATRSLVRSMAAPGPNVFIHCAGMAENRVLAETTDDAWRTSMAVNCQSAFVACQELAPLMARSGGGDVVFVGALDRTQSVRIPASFAASQGALSSLAMALGKELGQSGIRVNQLALGFLESGLSSCLPDLRQDFQRYSALRRCGGTAEVARIVLWLALENTYITGKVIAVNGGI